jgi:hypothetical protein
MPQWELPRAAWERFLADKDAAALLAAVRANPPLRRPVDADYPEYHRLRDVDLGGEAYRVCRLVDPDDGRERLFIEPTDVPAFDSEGVPYWLRGEALRRWVRDETEYPADDETDWESYRPRPGGERD